MLVLLALNVSLMIVFFGLWVGVPAWLVLRHADERHAAPRVFAVLSLPERRKDHSHAA